ncbi:hypothetical protein [Candidatus Methanocrinis natronophilus]|uniref:Uncharacterized protein n=1 Tax=Candidatus Methanocrinis natronophilus TaxID=3033396 RepID=A0ABT5XB89_9EURY|nr:hypothetical protein [Candidatus Methanocrinis natronophilus]MDF0591940.1 hypothetical protein [Candidatus Methanocrinis natronophilus]
MTRKGEELTALYAEFDRRFAELKRLIWRIRMLEEEETNSSPKFPDRSKNSPPERRCWE